MKERERTTIHAGKAEQCGYPPLPSLPLLRASTSCKTAGVPAYAPVASRAGVRPSSTKEAVVQAVMKHLPPNAHTSEEVLAMVRKAVRDALPDTSSGNTSAAPASSAAPHAVCGRTVAGPVVAVAGKSVTFDNFFGAPEGLVKIADVITSREGSPMGSGFLEWNNYSFSWVLTYAEVDVVLEGELHIACQGKTVVGKPGDMLFIPKDTEVVFSSPGHVRFAYVTWPADWSGTLPEAKGAV